MSQVISGNAEKGGLSVLLFHCLFNDGGSITHFTHEYDPELYQVLPNLYAVCIAERSGNNRKITGGFVIKTSYTHNDQDFLATLTQAVSIEPRLSNLVGSRASFLPARIGVPVGGPITEAEMLRVMVDQSLKHSAVGSA
jgi:hypothetical protein